MCQHRIEADKSGVLVYRGGLDNRDGVATEAFAYDIKAAGQRAYRKARPGLRGDEAPMMPMSDFSGLLSSACALASAAAIAPIDSLDRCMAALHA
jgi:hypothetical protein